ncbi:MAG: hypothetical protein GWP09_02865 [Nitrospiraceae bacterium]|nr:hypothetical protein [Nitrospiraceae bacterium]
MYNLVAITDHKTDQFFIDIYSGNYDLGKDYDISHINGYSLKITRNLKENKINHDGNHNDNHDNEIIYLLRGEEITTKEDYHVLAIANTEEPKNHRSLDETITELNEMDAIVILPHPTITLSSGVGIKNIIRLNKQYAIDAIETNGRIVFPLTYYNLLTKIIGKKEGIPVISNPDAHDEGFYFNTYLTLFEKQGFEEDNIKGFLREKLKKGKFLIEENTYSISKMWSYYFKDMIKRVLYHLKN